MNVQYYITDSGDKPAKTWLDGLDDVTEGRIRTFITRLRLGNFASAKPVGDGVHELVMDFGPGYRLYFGSVDDQLIMLLNGGEKDRQRSDIRQAKAHWANYLKRRKNKEKKR